MKIGSDNVDKDYLLCKIHSYPKHRRRFTARNEIYAINFRHFLTDATLLRTCHATRIPRNTLFLLSFSFSFLFFFLFLHRYCPSSIFTFYIHSVTLRYSNLTHEKWLDGRTLLICTLEVHENIVYILNHTHRHSTLQN